MELPVETHLTELFTEEIYSLPPKVTVVLPDEWTGLSGEHRLLLQKILEAVNIPLSAVRIVTAAVVDEQKIMRWQARELFIFGSATLPEIEAYTWSTLAQIPVLRCDPLHTLDDARKKSLWKALKEKYRP